VSNLAEWLERTGHETLTYLEHAAPEHRRLLKTTNSMEHDRAEVRRRSRVVRIFPNEASLIRPGSQHQVADPYGVVTHANPSSTV
jgi:putative transposase